MNITIPKNYLYAFLWLFIIRIIPLQQWHCRQTEPHNTAGQSISRGEKHQFRTLSGWCIKSNTGIFILTRHPFSGFASGIPAFCIWTTAAVKVWRPGDGVSGAGGTAGQSCHRRPSYTSRTVTLPTALCSMNWRVVGVGFILLSPASQLLQMKREWKTHVSSETLGTNCHGVVVAGPEKPLDCKTISDTRYIWDTPRSSGRDYNVFP